MALIRKNLSSWQDGTYTRRARYFHPTDNQAAIRASNYFNDEWKALPKGTILDAVATADATPALCTYIVTASAAGGVTLALLTTT